MAQMLPGYAHGCGIATSSKLVVYTSIQWCYIYIYNT